MEKTCTIWSIVKQNLIGEALETRLRKQFEGWTIVTHDGNGSFLAALDRGERPDVALTMLRGPGLDGYSVLRALRERCPGVPAVVLTEKQPSLVGMDLAISMGAKGYVHLAGPHTTEAGLKQLIASVSAGRFVAETPELQAEAERLANNERPISGTAKLSDKHLDLMRNVKEEGKDIVRAEALGFSKDQLNEKLKKLYSLTGKKNFASLLLLAVELELR